MPKDDRLALGVTADPIMQTHPVDRRERAPQAQICADSAAMPAVMTVRPGLSLDRVNGP